MNLTFINDLGQTFTVEIDSSMELENVMALLEVESGIPVNEQSINHEGRELMNPKATMAQLGVPSDGLLLLRRKVANVGGRSVHQDSEMMRLQLLGDPRLMAQLQQTVPELAEAAQNNRVRFAELLRQTRERQHEAETAKQREVDRLNADPFDIEAQRRIEEAIRNEAVLENMEHALEYSPESFGRVTMLYIPVEVNGRPVKAFVDSGAQTTIMSPEAAEACGIMRLIDQRFSGIARGVGTANILGRVHSAQLKLADLFLPCSFTIMEGREVDLLLGLDMLKGHRACIDLEKNVLRIQGREVSFLSEHELPEKAKDSKEFADLLEGTAAQAPSSTASNPGPSNPNPGLGNPTPASFPGGGRTLGSAPANLAAPGTAARSVPQPASRHPESSIRTLMDLGVSREVAISTLDAAGGNVDVAASLLF